MILFKRPFKAMYKASILSALLTTGISTFSHATTAVKLTTKIWPPYHYFDSQEKLTGESVEVIKCAFNKIDTPLEIQVLPWARAQQQVKINNADGFFSASWNEKRDQYAVRTTDIAEQKWTWFYLDPSIDPNSIEFKENTEVAATNGSNIANWLDANDYKLKNIVSETENLIQMLIKNRIEIFMGNELVVEKMMEEQNLNADFIKSTARSMPVGIYFSKYFLKSQNPDFMPLLNNAITDCRYDNDR